MQFDDLDFGGAVNIWPPQWPQRPVAGMDLANSLKADLLQAMQAIKKEGYHSVFLMLTDTTQQATDLLFVSDDPAAVRAAWGIDPQGSSVWLPGVMSRKSQIIPALLKAFK